MKIGNVELDNKVFLSPMAGVTDLPFRLICKEQDCGMLYTMRKLYVMMMQIQRKC